MSKKNVWQFKHHNEELQKIADDLDRMLEEAINTTNLGLNVPIPEEEVHVEQPKKAPPKFANDIDRMIYEFNERTSGGLIF